MPMLTTLRTSMLRTLLIGVLAAAIAGCTTTPTEPPAVDLPPSTTGDLHLERWWTYPGTTKLLISEYLKYLPALARLGATQLVSKITTGKTSVAVEDASEP